MSHEKLIVTWLLCATLAGCATEQPTSEQAAVTAMNKGLAAARNQDFAAALEHLQQATMLDASNHQAWHTLGEVHRQQQSWAMAVDALEKAVALADTEPLYRHHLGLALYERGDRPSARYQLDMARMLYEKAGGDTTEVMAYLERIKADEERELRKLQADKARAVDEARQAGVLGALGDGGGVASITGTGDMSSGGHDHEVYGGLLGNEADDTEGGFGFGRSGFGPGGGGTGWGTIGTGSYGIIGQGPGSGARRGGASTRAAIPQVRIGNATATGDLDKNLIRRYIRRKLPQIVYCYEKQLLATPGLAGTVIASFQITADGTVQASSASGVSERVSSCIAEVVAAIQFPKPKDGEVAKVRFPFTFRPSE